LERIGKVASSSKETPVDDRTVWSFARLLDWHLTRGTRPEGRPEVPGLQWTNAKFAVAVNSDERAIRDWRRGRHAPVDIAPIERELFGAPPAYAEWRMELRAAHQVARTSKDGQSSKPDGSIVVTSVSASNIPVRVPTHFMGRDDALVAIETALARFEGRVAITALHGMRGVGKTTLAAAYAERHRDDYCATWWIRAQAEITMRADLVALGMRLGWIGADDKEEQALAAVMEQLRQKGKDVLLIYDNAIDARAIEAYLPRGGTAKVLVTSNAPAWRGVAAPVEIRVWPKTIGVDYLIARTGRAAERQAAETLSEALGGLPLAHEQAAAYCERLHVSLSEYAKRFAATPTRLLNDARHAPTAYHDGRTVAKTFALAIEEAAKLHPAAEPLIVHAAQLAPEPIPLFLFTEARKELGEPLATALAADGLDEAVAALRDFALIDCETITSDRDPVAETDAIRLHRLVREVAAVRRDVQRALVAALAVAFPDNAINNPALWQRCAPLTPHLLAICETEFADAESRLQCGVLLQRAGSFFHGCAAYGVARRLYERALAIREKVLGPEHPDTATSLAGLAVLLQDQGDLVGARPLYERALAIREKVLGPEHPDTAASLANLALLLEALGDLIGARPLYERALAIREKVLGPEHPDTAESLSDLAFLHQAQGDLAGAQPLYERALAIREKVLGPEHPDTAQSLNNLGFLLQAQGEYAGARPLYERALAIREKMLGPEHPHTATSLTDLAALLQAQGDPPGARPLAERALAIHEKVLGPEHPHTATSLNNLAALLDEQGNFVESRPLKVRALAIREKVLGPEHADTAASINNLAFLLQAQGDLAEARPLYERALAIWEKTLGGEHPITNRGRRNLARLLLAMQQPAEALALGETALAGHEKVLGSNHAWTKGSASTTVDALEALGHSDEASALRARYSIGGTSL
jgi:tetratricopeptide (TPR) repeat protein